MNDSTHSYMNESDILNEFEEIIQWLTHYDNELEPPTGGLVSYLKVEFHYG